MRKGILWPGVAWVAAALPAAGQTPVAGPPPAGGPFVATVSGALPDVGPAGPAGADDAACPSLPPRAPAPREEEGGPPGRAWFNAEYLYWWIRDGRVPPLVTTGPARGAGILGRPGTETLFGPDSRIDGSGRSGGRFTAGLWLDEGLTTGVEGSYFFLGSQGKDFAAAGTGAPGSPALSRPFFNAVRGREDSELVAFPGLLAGRVGVSTSSRLQGFEANALCNLCCGCSYRLDALAGFRYLDLAEGVAVTEDLSVLPGVPAIGGTGFGILDSFDAHDRFYGGQVGLRGEVSRGRLFASMAAKVALGDSRETVDVGGFTRTTRRGAATLAPGGLLTQTTNIGRYKQDEFAVVPEATFAVGCRLTEHVRASVGYSFLYWSSVARPGDQIDRAVNPTLLPLTGGTAAVTGPARPAFTFRDTDFWAQGINFGLEFRY